MSSTRPKVIIPIVTEHVPTCPHCGARVDCHHNTTGDDRPASGDWSVCAHCAGVSIYAVEGDKFSLRKPFTDQEKLDAADVLEAVLV